MSELREGSRSKRQEGMCDAKAINRTMMHTALEMARNIRASAIVIYVDVLGGVAELEEMPPSEIKLILASSVVEPEELTNITSDLVRVPRIDFNRTGQVKISLMLAFARGLINDGDRLICLSGSRRNRTLDHLVVVNVGRELEFFSSQQANMMKEMPRPEVFETLLSLALELGREGREGKPAGTVFVLGDHERVLQFSRQMVINPFGGVPEEERNVMDPLLKGSIKEFSAIDGAFVIREDGVVMAAGRHLDASGEKLSLPQGLGSRHLAAAGITAITSAVALVVSESTGDLRIFNDGKMFMEIEKTTAEM